MHGALQLAALALPLLVVAHRLGRGPLPCGGSGVVVHIVESALLVHSLLPAARVTQRVRSEREAGGLQQYLYWAHQEWVDVLKAN